jgi:hypothetical protein
MNATNMIDLRDSYNWTIEDFELAYYEAGFSDEDAVKMAKAAYEELHSDEA